MPDVLLLFAGAGEAKAAMTTTGKIATTESRVGLTLEKTLAEEATNSWKATGFAEGYLQKHFDKHVIKRAEWGADSSMTVDQYLNKSKKLLNSSAKGDVDGFVSNEGWVFRYNKATNEFATAKPDGTIETFFRPKEGIDYWKGQMELYKPK